MTVHSILSTLDPEHTDERGCAQHAQVLVIETGLVIWVPLHRGLGHCITNKSSAAPEPGLVYGQAAWMMQNNSDGVCFVARCSTGTDLSKVHRLCKVSAFICNTINRSCAGEHKV